MLYTFFEFSCIFYGKNNQYILNNMLILFQNKLRTGCCVNFDTCTVLQFSVKIKEVCSATKQIEFSNILCNDMEDNLDFTLSVILQNLVKVSVIVPDSTSCPMTSCSRSWLRPGTRSLYSHISGSASMPLPNSSSASSSLRTQKVRYLAETKPFCDSSILK